MKKQMKYPPMIIGKNKGRCYRGAETEEYIFYCNYETDNIDAAVLMFRKEDFAKDSNWFFGYAGLHCDNRHATEHLLNLMLNGEQSFTYLSPTMREKVTKLTEIVILRAFGRGLEKKYFKEVQM